MAERRLSRIPMGPPSATKNTHYANQQNLRMSLAGNMPPPSGSHLRQSMAGPLRASSSTNKPGPTPARQGVFHPPPNALAQSQLRTPMANSNTARRSTMLPPRAPAPSSGTSGLLLSQDPRALRDRGTQKRMWDDIAHWLMSNSFDVHSQGLKPTTITGQSFRAIFQFLVQCADSAYVFPNAEDIRDRAKWEFEFVTALKYTGYPLLGNVKMEWLASPAAPHSWPSLLGILHWLAEEGKIRVEAETGGHPALQNAEYVPDDFEDDNEDHHGALAIEFYEKSYEHYLSTGLEDHPAEIEALKDRYASKNKTVIAETEEQESLQAELERERKELVNSRPNLEQARKEHETLLADLASCQVHEVKLTKRKQKAIDNLRLAEASLSQRRADVTRLESELQAAQRIVASQNLSPEEVSRMRTDHETLSSAEKELSRKLQEGRDTIARLEVLYANRVPKTEELVDEYNDRLLSVGLGTNANNDDGDLVLELQTASNDLSNLLLGPDITREVKPALKQLWADRQGQRASVEKEKLGVEHVLQGIVMECNKLSDKQETLRREIAGLMQDAETIEEESARQAEHNNAEIEKLDAEITRTKHSAKERGLSAKMRLQALQFASQEQTEKLSRLKAETIKKVADQKDELVRFREDCAKTFMELHMHAEKKMKGSGAAIVPET